MAPTAMSKHLVRFLALTLLLAASTACATLFGPRTPDEASRQFHLRDAPESAVTFQVVATRPWERGAVVLFTYLRPARGQVPPLQMFGYDLAEPGNGGVWHTAGGSAGGKPWGPPPVELIDYGTGSGWNQLRGDFTIVYGRTLVPQVASVEATFDSGLRLRDGAGDGFFVLITPTKTTPCELRALDVDGEVLRRIDATPPTGPDDRPGSRRDNCSSSDEK